jgi:putative SOS response-associated peptidase YedK
LLPVVKQTVAAPVVKIGGSSAGGCRPHGEDSQRGGKRTLHASMSSKGTDEGKSFGMTAEWTFTIVTTAPNALCAPIHNRMPVILDAADYSRWLGEAAATSDELQALLKPFPAERMQAHPIGPRIGNVENDDAALIERLSSVASLTPARR